MDKFWENYIKTRPSDSKGAFDAFKQMHQEPRIMAQEPRNMAQGGVIGKPGGVVEPGVEYYANKIKLTSTHKKNILAWGKNKGGGEWSNEKIFKEYEKSGPNRRFDIREGTQKGTTQPLKKLSPKEVQALYKDLPENVSIQVQKRGKNKIPEYTFRAKVSGKNVGKENWTMDLKATPENKTKIIEETQKVLDKYHPNRLSREEYAKLRLKPENKRLRGEDFAKKLNDAGYTTYTGDEWARENVYNYDKETPRGKPLAKDLGFFEKRTVAEAKDIINQYSGGKHFLKNKNLTDTDITTRAAEYVAMEKNIEKTGGTYSFPRGKQNKRKVWQNIYSSHAKDGRFKLANAAELPKFEDGRINWRKDKAWRKAKFKDSKSGKIFTYGNLEEMVDKHGGGWKKAIKAYDDNAKLNQMTFKGKALNEWFREGMIKKEYETLVGKKVPLNDKGLQKYMGEKKPYYSFTEAHHFKGVKDHPFDTESSFRYANRRQGNLQNSYDKAIKSGDPDRIAKAKIKYAEDMTKLSDDMGGIRYKTDKKFIGQKGTPESIIKAAAKESGFSEKNLSVLLKQLCPKGQASGGRIGYQTAGSVTGTLECGINQFNKNLKTGNANSALMKRILQGGGNILKAGAQQLNPAELLKLRNLVGPQALGFFAAYEAGDITDDVLRKGVPLNEALSKNWLTKSFMPYSEEFAKQKNLLQSGLLNTDAQRIYALDMMKSEKAWKEMDRIEGMEANQLVEGTLDDDIIFNSQEDIDAAKSDVSRVIEDLDSRDSFRNTGKQMENIAAMDEMEASRLDKFKLPFQSDKGTRLVNKLATPPGKRTGPMTAKREMKIDYSLPTYDRTNLTEQDVRDIYKDKGWISPTEYKSGYKLSPGELTWWKMENPGRGTYGTQEKFMGGGIVGIRKPHAIPPEKGGLRSIMINVNDD